MRVKVPMNHHLQRQLMHHRCQELIRRGERKVVCLSTLRWSVEKVDLGGALNSRHEFTFLEGSHTHRQGNREIGASLATWNQSQLQLSIAFGKRPHAAWLPTGTPTRQRALAVSLSADLAAAWLRPVDLQQLTKWSPPRPREQAHHFTKFEELVDVECSERGFTVKTRFSFSHREPPGTERGDALNARGLATTLFSPDGSTLLEADSKTLYYRYGREVGIDQFRLGPTAKPFSWS